MEVEAVLFHAVKTNSLKQAVIFLSFFFCWCNDERWRSVSTVWNYERNFIFYGLSSIVNFSIFLSCWQIRLPAKFLNCSAISEYEQFWKKVALMRLYGLVNAVFFTCMCFRGLNGFSVCWAFFFKICIAIRFLHRVWHQSATVLLSANCTFSSTKCLWSQWAPAAWQKLASSRKQRLGLIAVSASIKGGFRFDRCSLNWNATESLSFNFSLKACRKKKNMLSKSETEGNKKSNSALSNQLKFQELLTVLSHGKSFC